MRQKTFNPIVEFTMKEKNQEGEAVDVKEDTAVDVEAKEALAKQIAETVESIGEEKLTAEVASIFSGQLEGLDEAESKKLIETAETVFASTIKANMKKIVSHMQESYDAIVAEGVATASAEQEKMMTEMLEKKATEFVEENKVVFEQQAELERLQLLATNIHESLVQSGINMPEETVEAFDEHINANIKLEQKLNEELEKNLQLAEQVKEYAKKEIVAEVSEGMTVTEKATFEKVAMEIAFTDAETYTESLQNVAEWSFNKKFKKKDEGDADDGDVKDDEGKIEADVTEPTEKPKDEKKKVSTFSKFNK